MTAMRLAGRRPRVAAGRVVVALRLGAWMATGAVLASPADVAVLGAAVGGLGFVLCTTLWTAMRRWVEEAPSEEWLRFRRLFTWPASVMPFLFEVYVLLVCLRSFASLVLGTPVLPPSE